MKMLNVRHQAPNAIQRPATTLQLSNISNTDIYDLHLLHIPLVNLVDYRSRGGYHGEF